VASEHAVQSAVPVVGVGVSGIEGHGSREFMFCPRPIPFKIAFDDAQGRVRLGQEVVEFESLHRRGFRFRIGFPERESVVVAKNCVGVGEARVTLRERGIEVERLLKKREGLLRAFCRALAPIEAAL